MRVSRWLAPIVSVVVLFGGIGIAQLTGVWITSGRQAIVPGQSMTVDELRGWMTLQQAAEGLGVPVAVLIEEVRAPEGVVITPSTAFKDLESLVPDLDLATFRDRLSVRLSGQGASSAPSAGTEADHQPTLAPGGSITGQHTLRQVAENAGVGVADLVAEAGLPPGVDVDVPLRTLRETVAGFEIQTVRDALERVN